MNLEILNKQVEFYSFEWEGFSFWRKLYLNNVYVKAAFFPYRIITHLSNNPSNIYTVKSMKRADYDAFWKVIFYDIDCNQFEIIDSFSFNFNLIFNMNLLVNIFLSLKNYSLCKRLYVVMSMSRYLGAYPPLGGQDAKLICHAEMQPIENYLVEYFRCSGNKSITLQHGLYIDYSSCKNINILNYTNVSTDFFLSWGEDTSSLIRRYNEGVDVIDCGYPFEPLPRKRNVVKRSYISVIFDQNLFIKENQIIYDIAYQIAKILCIDVNIRLHPRNSLDSYFINDSTLLDLPCEDSIFVLAHTTSYIVELMMNDVKVFVYDSDVPKLPFPDIILFRDINSLNKILEMNFHDGYFSDCSKRFLGSSGYHSICKYKSTIEKLCKFG